jgi:hypothetical protein
MSNFFKISETEVAVRNWIWYDSKILGVSYNSFVFTSTAIARKWGKAKINLQNKTMLMRISGSNGRKETFALFCRLSDVFVFIVIVDSQRLRWSRGSVLAFGTQVRGFAPGRSRRIFGVKKSSARLPSACKRSLNVAWKSAFRQNYRTFLAHSFTFRRWVRWHAWKRLVAKVGTSNPYCTISLKGYSA